MKASLNAWSVNPDSDFETMFCDVKKAGFEGIELNVDGNGKHSLTLKTSDILLDEIKSLSDKYNLPVVSISTSLWGTFMGTDTPEAFEKSKRILECQLRFAKYIGAGGILIVPGGMSDTITLKQAYINCRKTLRSLRETIESYKINVGVENVWNGFFTSPFSMADFIDSVECKYVGAYYDIGNTIAFSRTEDWIDILEKRIKNVHIKGFRLFSCINAGGEWVDISKSSVDWKRIRKALGSIGYDGYVTGEVFKDDPNIDWESFYHTVCTEINEIIK